MLDLHSLALEQAPDEAHRLRPMFIHPVLNRTIIVKHHPRPGEFEYAPDRGAIVTKVIFPFDPDDLDLGGQFLLVDEPRPGRPSSAATSTTRDRHRRTT